MASFEHTHPPATSPGVADSEPMADGAQVFTVVARGDGAASDSAEAAEASPPAEPVPKRKNQLTVQDKINKAQAEKTKGNDHFKAGEYKKVRMLLSIAFMAKRSRQVFLFMSMIT